MESPVASTTAINRTINTTCGGRILCRRLGSGTGLPMLSAPASSANGRSSLPDIPPPTLDRPTTTHGSRGMIAFPTAGAVDDAERQEAAIEVELKVHEEIDAFVQQMQRSLESQTESWRLRHVEDKRAREEALAALRLERAALRQRFLEITALMELRGSEMSQYEAERQRKRENAEHAQFLSRSATRVQAWWKGVMVRRHLGPYRAGAAHAKKKVGAGDKKQAAAARAK